jgi:hypothetical protein
LGDAKAFDSMFWSAVSEYLDSKRRGQNGIFNHGFVSPIPGRIVVFDHICVLLGLDLGWTVLFSEIQGVPLLFSIASPSGAERVLAMLEDSLWIPKYIVKNWSVPFDSSCELSPDHSLEKWSVR